MADSVENARTRRREIMQELEEIDLFLRLHERFSRTNTESADTRQVDSPVETVGNPLLRALGAEENSYTPDEMMEVEDAVRRASRPRGRPADFVRIMEGILKDVQHPLLRGEFVAELEKRGYAIPSDDKARYLGTILWRNGDIFENVEGRGYWLKGRPLPTGGLHPIAEAIAQLNDKFER